MNTPDEKLNTLTGRMDELKREISDISKARPGSDNSALEDLEGVLLRELHSIEGQIRQIQSYIDKCHSGASRDD
ncbi:hypothetical protein B7486_15190 [cyanobacterium TDX16]|nr:hypothetical protein B7486_15190 [cyanobacterium TDX16]